MFTGNTNLRLLAYYLPQFYPIPENDLWWGKGFTEWTNVTKARPLFRGHYQPHLPADLGFYDLRLPDTREAQAELAREYGIYGFIYFHYWLHGRRLLGRPFDEVLSSGRPDFPFCLSWANHNWTRVWDGEAHHVLLAQTYSEDDDRQHMRWLAGAFADRRYIRVNGKPLFLVYRASLLPNPLRTTSIWREEASKLGVGELFLARLQSDARELGDPASIGFDAAVEHQPSFHIFGRPLHLGIIRRASKRLGFIYSIYQKHLVYDYADVVERALAESPPPYKRFPSVTPSWDNSSRRQTGAVILKNSTPALYEKWLTAVIKRFVPASSEENFVFIDAWNEWAEGNHLEPCLRWGRSYLEATRNAVVAATGRKPQK